MTIDQSPGLGYRDSGSVCNFSSPPNQLLQQEPPVESRVERVSSIDHHLCENTQDYEEALSKEARNQVWATVQKFVQELIFPSPSIPQSSEAAADDGEIEAQIRAVAQKCIYKVSAIASTVATTRQNTNFAAREVNRKSHKASMIANAINIAVTRAEMFTEPSPYEIERAAAEAQKLGSATFMTRLQLVCAEEYLEENKGLLEAAMAIAEVSFKSCVLAVGNLGRIDERSLYRAKEVEEVLSMIEEVERIDLRSLEPHDRSLESFSVP